MSHITDGQTRTLLAANAAFRREPLWKCRQVWAHGFYDNEVSDALIALGHTVALDSKASVTSHLTMTLTQAMGHLFAGGRRFGGYRRSRSGMLARLFWMFAVVAVPALYLARLARRVISRRPGLLPRFLLALPYLLCLIMAWTAGEAVGYVLPDRGRASEPIGN